MADGRPNTARGMSEHQLVNRGTRRKVAQLNITASRLARPSISDRGTCIKLNRSFLYLK